MLEHLEQHQMKLFLKFCILTNNLQFNFRFLNIIIYLKEYVSEY